MACSSELVVCATGEWVAILKLCSGTSSGAVLMQLVLCNPGLAVGENLDGQGY